MVCVLLSIAFSSSVSAEVLSNIPQSFLVQENVIVKDGNDTFLSGYFDFTTNDGVTEKTSYTSKDVVYTPNINLTSTHTYKFLGNVSSSGGFEVLFPKSKQVNITLQRLAYAIKIHNGTYITTPTNVKLLLYYTDGSFEYVNDVDFVNDSSNKYRSDLSASFLPKKDVNMFEVIISNTLPMGTVTIYLGENDGTQEGYYLTVDQVTKTEGLLGGLVEWVKKVVNSITELPQKIWELISNGLKSLFVPSEDFIIQFKNDLDSMLEEKLGAVYQVVNIMAESWDRVTANDISNTINIPSTTINLSEGNTFTFGGYDVQIVPVGFDFIVNILKTVIGIVCTILCVNALRKKYDEVMGVVQ